MLLGNYLLKRKREWSSNR